MNWGFRYRKIEVCVEVKGSWRGFSLDLSVFNLRLKSSAAWEVLLDISGISINGAFLKWVQSQQDG
ncbi:hypothetical protein ACS0TY_013725 [Phlomoides rotata]